MACWNWTVAAGAVGFFQLARGVFGLLMLLIIITAGAAAKDCQSIAGIIAGTGICTSGTKVVCIYLLLLALQVAYVVLGEFLMEGIEHVDYHTCKCWLWAMTFLTVIQAFVFALLINFENLHVAFFIDPVCNFVTLWIVYQYMLYLISEDIGFRATFLSTLNLKPLTAAQIQPYTDAPPSYEESTAHNPIPAHSYVV